MTAEYTWDPAPYRVWVAQQQCSTCGASARARYADHIDVTHPDSRYRQWKEGPEVFACAEHLRAVDGDDVETAEAPFRSV